MELWRLGVYALGVALLVAVMLGVPQLLGERPRRRHRRTAEPYEAGVATTGSARVRMSSHYYLVAAMFVIFDLEAIFLFAWAVAARELGWAGYVEAALFAGILLAGLIYLWRNGALDWGTSAFLRTARAQSAALVPARTAVGSFGDAAGRRPSPPEKP